MLELLASCLLGCLTGIFTGFVPGIHPNTVIFSSIPLYFHQGIGLPIYASFISGLSVVHTFHDFLPAIFLSAPSSESAVASLPGGEMVSEGRGREAFMHTVNGGLVAVLFFIPASLLLFFLLDDLYGVVEALMPPILLFFLFFMMFDSESWLSPLVAVLSGLLGILAFRMPVNQNFVLMPVFSGLFAVPAVLESLSGEPGFPDQEECEASVSVKGGFAGFLAGLIAGVLPGVGAGTATGFLSPLIDDMEEALAGLGAVNTADIFVSFIALVLIGEARSGASVALQTLGGSGMSVVLTAAGCSFLAAGFSILIASHSLDLFLGLVEALELRVVLVLVLAVIVGASFVLNGFFGLLVLFTSSCIGLLAWRAGCRLSSMAVLVVPALLLYLGVGIFI